MGILFVYNFNNILKHDFISITVLVTTIYLLAQKKTKSTLCYLLALSGCFESIIAFLQLGNVLPSNNIFFKATGSFENPGPLGGYLAICFIANVCIYKKKKRWFAIVCSFILGAGLILSDSRAAWLAVLIVLTYMVLRFFRISTYKRICIFILLSIIGGITSLNIYKTESAKGRLIIWKICTNMIIKHPWCGTGVASFKSEYMNTQAEFIRQHPNNKENKLLSNNCFAFNEFLHITCEQGIIGLLLVVSILVILIYRNKHQKFSLFPCLITYILFVCFSYPFDVFLLIVILALLLGSLSVNGSCIVKTSSIYTILLTTLFYFAIIGILVNHWTRKTQMEKALSSFLYRDDYRSLSHIQRNYFSISHSTDFILRYARILYLKGEYKLAIPVMRQAIELYPTTDKYCDLGYIYEQTGNDLLAERAYKSAIYLLPHEIYPYYCLFLLYERMEQKKSVIEVGLQILRMNIFKT